MSVHLWWVPNELRSIWNNNQLGHRNSQRPVWWYVFVVTSWCCLSYGFLWCWGSCFFLHIFEHPKKWHWFILTRKPTAPRLKNQDCYKLKDSRWLWSLGTLKKTEFFWEFFWGLKPQGRRFSQPKWWLYMTLPWKTHGFDSHSSHLTWFNHGCRGVFEMGIRGSDWHQPFSEKPSQEERSLRTNEKPLELGYLLVMTNIAMGNGP